MKVFLQTLALFMGLILVTSPLKAQTMPTAVSVSGRIITESGEVLPGVSIVVKGTSVGTTSNSDGRYKLTLNSQQVNSSLVFSYIGYLSREISVGDRSTIDVTLAVDAKSLTEVVVVGYGTQKQRDVLGSIATVKGENLTFKASGNFLDALKGQAAGVSISTQGGTPGAPVNVNVRGVHSINTSSDPLWVIDGIPLTSGGGAGPENNSRGSIGQSALSLINPNDIESIEVLKDAAATAIYGSRGANGVILVTTKRGTRGQSTTSISYSSGLTMLSKSPESMGFANSKEWWALSDMAWKNAGKTTENTPDGYMTANAYLISKPTRQQALSTDTNWFDELLRTGSYQDMSVSSSRGFDKGFIGFSLNYRDEKSVVKNNDLKRITGRINMEYDIANNLTAGGRLYFATTTNDRNKALAAPIGFKGAPSVSGGFGTLSKYALPWFPIYDPTNPTGYWNPISGLNLTASNDRAYQLDKLQQYRGMGGMYLNYNFPFLKGLSARLEGSFDISQLYGTIWTNSALVENNLGTFGYEGSTISTNIVYNAYATYNHTFGQHDVSVTGGSEWNRSSAYTRSAEAYGLTGSYQQLGVVQSGNKSVAGYLNSERYFRSYFGRANYKFKDRYLAGVSFRYDGISAFAADQRWGFFPAVSAGWIVSDEAFMKNVSVISQLKLRGSYGKTGNSNVPAGNLVENTYGKNAIANALYLYNPSSIGGKTELSNIGNPSLTWETNASFDVGVDFGLLQNRISGSLAYFNQNINGLLLQSSMPPSAGKPGGYWANIGSMINKGWEFSVNSVNLNTNGFRWSTAFNITNNSNVVVATSPQLDAKNTPIFMGNNLINKSGLPVGSYWLYESAGVDPEKGVEMLWEIDQALKAKTGELVRTGRKIPATSNNVINNRAYIAKTRTPKWFGGITNSFSYKGFDLNLMFTFQTGAYAYDDVVASASFVSNEPNIFLKKMLTESWTPENKNAQYPQISYALNYPWGWDATANDGKGDWRATTSSEFNGQNFTLSDRYLFKTDFLRLKNLELGYTLPKTLTSKLHGNRARVYVSSTNIWTLTNYPGWDPEVPGFGTVPNAKTYNVGATFSF